MLNIVPLSTQSLGQTQPLINSNFSVIDTAFTVASAQPQHVPYNDISGNQGMHNLVQFPLYSGSTNPPTIPSGQFGIYNLANSNTGKNELNINRTTGAGTVQTPFTAYVLGGSDVGNGWTYLPSGLLMAWGRSSTGSSSSITLVYSAELTNFPGFTTANAFPIISRKTGTIPSIPIDNFVALSNYTQTTFTVYASAAGATNVNFMWFVIGI